MSSPPDEPTRVSEETLRAFESDIPRREPELPRAPAASRRGGATLLILAFCIAVGAVYVLVWLL